jgi:hypothetical protein
MELIAINNKETWRVVMFGDHYHLQRTVSKIFSSSLWADVNTTQHEWLASKWILDKGLTVCTDYPTIAEIRSKQKETDHGNE